MIGFGFSCHRKHKNRRKCLHGYLKKKPHQCCRHKHRWTCPQFSCGGGESWAYDVNTRCHIWYEHQPWTLRWFAETLTVNVISWQPGCTRTCMLTWRANFSSFYLHIYFIFKLSNKVPPYVDSSHIAAVCWSDFQQLSKATQEFIDLFFADFDWRKTAEKTQMHI